MSLSIIINSTMWTIDPTHKNADITPEVIIKMCGSAPKFFKDSDDPQSPQQIFDNAVKAYGFPVNETENGEIDACGVYLDPVDPPLYPLLVTSLSGTPVRIYEYGFVAIGQRIFRFD